MKSKYMYGLVLLLLVAPWVAAMFYDRDTIWYVDVIATKLLVILLFIHMCVSSKRTINLKELVLPLVILCVMLHVTVSQFKDALPVDSKPTFHFVSESKNE